MRSSTVSRRRRIAEVFLHHSKQQLSRNSDPLEKSTIGRTPVNALCRYRRRPVVTGERMSMLRKLSQAGSFTSHPFS